jgi:hypothetical protein
MRGTTRRSFFRTVAGAGVCAASRPVPAASDYRYEGKEFGGGAQRLPLVKEGGQEFLFVCDIQRGVVVKTTLDGEEVFTIGYPRESEFHRLDHDGRPLLKFRPTDVEFAPNGDIYVSDGSGYIHQYDRDGGFIRTLARRRCAKSGSG